MDAGRLASILRSLTASNSRRAVLGVVLGGPVVVQRLTQTEASTRKKRKRNPCKGKADDAPCKGTGRCLSGDCIPKPPCLPAGGECTTNVNGCCSHFCLTSAGTPFDCLGKLAEAGDACQSSDDCDSGLECLGYVCQSLTCIPTSDYCADRTSRCGSDGAALCLRSIGGGRTRCGRLSPMTCGCTNNRQCIAALGTGAFCAKFERGGACICNNQTTFCAVLA